MTDRKSTLAALKDSSYDAPDTQNRFTASIRISDPAVSVDAAQAAMNLMREDLKKQGVEPTKFSVEAGYTAHPIHQHGSGREIKVGPSFQMQFKPEHAEKVQNYFKALEKEILPPRAARPEQTLQPLA